ncbi:kazal-type serine protease inhibitor domain-containing protein [Ditylenchus destructor]|nr:kazal-type serine protease inhibitor domain-containing protein [Ditylenchus destructor]
MIFENKLFLFPTSLLHLLLFFVEDLSANEDCPCGRLFKPLCGTDSQTYENECMLNCFKKLNPDLRLDYMGTCCPHSRLCVSYSDPVCDERGTTHENECIFEYYKCVEKRRKGVLLGIQSRGRCPKNRECDFFCDESWQPLCDAKGHTHKNFCKFDLTNCRILSRGLPALRIAHAGPCPNSKDTHNGRPGSPRDIRPHQRRWFFSNLENVPKATANNKFSRGVATYAKKKEVFEQKRKPQSEKYSPATSTTALIVNPTTSPPSKYFHTTEFGLEEDRNLFEENTAFPTNWTGTFEKPRTAAAVTSIQFIKLPENNTAVDSISTPESVEDQYSATANISIKMCSAEDCDKIWDPLCDTENTTHRNECLFRFHLCKLDRDKESDDSGRQAQLPTIAYYGKCGKYARRRDPDAHPKTLTISKCDICSKTEGDEIVPICDNANQTHQSICLFAQWNCERRMEGLEERILVHIGVCHLVSPVFGLDEEVCPGRCSKQWKPVCDTNAVTHPNLCAFQMHNCHQRKMKKVHQAGWLKSLRPCNVTGESGDVSKSFTEKPSYTPGRVESTTTVSYKTAHTNKIPKTTTLFPVTAAFAECPKRECDDNTQSQGPICDNEGRVHVNDCHFAHAHCLAAQQGKTLRIVSDEECSAVESYEAKCEVKNCTLEHDPYCGSDFHTYENYCLLRKAQCEDDKLEILFKGECGLCLQSPCPTTDPSSDDDSLFVCDQSGETKTKCEFEMLRCIYEIKYGYNISIAYAGKCCDSNDVCPSLDDNASVCDSNGKTYHNRCFFDIARCRASKINRFQLEETNCTKNVSNENSLEEGEKYFKELDNPIDEAVINLNQTNILTFSDLKSHSEESVEENLCPEDKYDPVCASQGNTYLNLCEFGQKRCESERKSGSNLTVAYYGPCKDLKCNTNCSKAYDPVCGSNGKTYANLCELKKSMCILEGRRNLTLDYNGECCENSQCHLELKPICDSIGRTHINYCEFQKEACRALRRSKVNLHVAYDGECCDTHAAKCSQEYEPVCDGKETHVNICHFRAKQCEADHRGEFLKILHSGECCVFLKGECEDSGPVCDSDGTTQKNRCFFEFKRCNAVKIQLKDISILHEGECCNVQNCTEVTEIKEDDMACDSNGVTHTSICHFENAKCNYDKTHSNGTMSLAYLGRCCTKNCDETIDQVCDQHGRFYKNRCIFEINACESRKKSGALLKETPCP